MEKRKFTLSESLNCLLIAFFCSYVIQLILIFFGFSSTDEVYLWLSYFINAASFFLVVLVYAKIRGVNYFSATSINFKINYFSIPVLFLISICVMLTSLFLSSSFSWLLEAIGCKTDVNIPDISSWKQVVLSIVIICIMAPVGEELIFRGAVFGSFLKRGVLKAVLLSSLIFSLMHANPSQTVHQFFLGIVLAILVLISDSVIPAVIVHFFNNLLALFLPFIFPVLGESFDFSFKILAIYLSLSVIGIGALAALIPLFFAVNKNGIKLSKASLKEAFDIFYKKDNFKNYITSFNVNNIIKGTDEERIYIKSENFKFALIITIFALLWLISFIGGFYV